MDLSPRMIRAYLDGHERNLARTWLDGARQAGYVFLNEDTRRIIANAKATIARDEDAPSEGREAQEVPDRLPDGTPIVRDVAGWLKQHGSGPPTRG